MQKVTLSDLMNELKVSITEIQITASFFGMKITGNQPHYPLNLEEANKIRSYFGSFNKVYQPTIKENNPKSAKFKDTESITEDFFAHNYKANDTIELINNNNKLASRKEYNIDIGSENINTIFTDAEAFSICAGMKENWMRKLAFKFDSGYGLVDKFQAHQIAMSALKKYGRSFLSYCLSLPPLPFKYGEASEIFSELEKRKKHTENPILRILHKNAFGQNEKISISFFTVTNSIERLRYNNILQVRNETNKQTIFKITNTGIIKPEKGAREIIPIIQLFLRFSRDTKKFLITYGVQTGECGVCGRKLTDLASIKYGIGPVCANSLGYRLS